jgi:hypothetical protein
MKLNCLNDQFGFSWRLACSPRKPRLSAIGFPWISLDSLVRNETYQWLIRHKPPKVSRDPFVSGGGGPSTALTSCHADKQDRPSGKLTLISDLQQ